MNANFVTNTDKIVFFLAIYLFWRGWSKGFLQTMLGPISLIIATILSYVYYVITRNMIIAIAIATLGPIILSIVLSMTIGTLLLAADKKNISLMSRFLGATINTVWGEFLLITGILMLLFIPLKIPLVLGIQGDIQQSWSYLQVKTKVNEIFGQDMAGTLDPEKLAILTDPKALENLGKTKEFQDIMNDPLIQDLLNDPKTTMAIEQKDIGKLMQSPKFIAITKNPDLLKKFLSLYGMILKPNASKKEANNSNINSP